MAVYRLAKVASELNRSTSAIAEFLQEKGHEVDARPTSKISEEQYQACLKEFSADKAMKEEADKLKSQKPVRTAPTAPHTTAPSVSEPVVPEPPIPAPIAEIVPEPKAVEPEKIDMRSEAPVSNLKVVGKIDLDPKKKKEPEAVAPEPAKEIPAETIQPAAPIAPAETVTPSETVVPEKNTAPAAEVTPIIESKTTVPTESKDSPKKEAPASDNKGKKQNEHKGNAKKTPAPQAPKVAEPAPEPEYLETKKEVLSGPKVLGRINLPTAKEGNSSLAKEARKDMQEIRKKRKRKEKGVDVKVAVQETINRDNRNKDSKDNTNKPTTANKGPVNPNAVKSNVRNTVNRMGNAGRRNNNKGKKRFEDREVRNRRFEEERRRKDEESKILKVTEFLTANELASLMSVPVTAVISKCFALGIMVSINQRLDAETIQLVASDYNYDVTFVDAESTIEAADEEVDRDEDLKPRAPIVTVMGHVDHGKTSLLDHVRSANVIAGEAGGITQHIGAYEVTLKDGKKITFLDTPGHEAFTAMRARGAKVTDLAIIVIAADYSVMPQTKEAIAHAQAAGVPMVFAFNKIDKDGANPDKIREELAQMNILVEDWGGKFQSQEISAKKGLNVDELLEKVLLEAELMDLKANPDRRAKGTVIEATQEKGRGIVCTLLIQNGTLRVGDHMVAGSQYAKVRAMFNERGTRIDEAPPATPVKILGFSDAPTSGDLFAVM